MKRIWVLYDDGYPVKIHTEEFPGCEAFVSVAELEELARKWRDTAFQKYQDSMTTVVLDGAAFELLAAISGNELLEEQR